MAWRNIHPSFDRETHWIREHLAVIFWTLAIGLISPLFSQSNPTHFPIQEDFSDSQTPTERTAAYSEFLRKQPTHLLDSLRPTLLEIEAYLNQIPWDDDRVRATMELGSYYFRSGAYAKAQHIFRDMQEYMETRPIDELSARWNSLHGNVLSASGKITEGLEFHLKALRAFEAMGDSTEIGITLSSLGMMYYNLGDFKSAESYFLQSEAINLATHNTQSLSINYNNLGSLMMDQGRHAEAEIFYQKGLPFAIQAKSNDDLIYLYANRVENFVKMGNLSGASQNLSKADSLLKITYDNDLQNLVYFAHARLLAAKGDKAGAQQYIQKAYQEAQEAGNLDLLVYSYQTMAALEKQIGNYEAALEHTEAYYHIMDTLRSEENMRSLEEMTAEYEAEKERAENAELLAEQEQLEVRQRLLLVGAIGAIAFLGLVALISLRANRRSRQFNKVLRERQQIIEQQYAELESTHQELQETHDEQDALMAIVAHDLKAPLNKLFSLLRMIEAFKEDEVQQNSMIAKSYEIIAGGQTLIDELVLVSSLDKTQKELELETQDLSQIVQSSFGSFQARATDKSIHLKLEVPATPVLFPTHTDYLNRVLDNLISNALKFSPKDTTVQISLTEIPDGAEIRVKDNGPGIPEKEQGLLFRKFAKLSNRPTGGETSTGLGLSIVKALVEKLGGEISFQSEVGKGTEFRIRFSRNAKP